MYSQISIRIIKGALETIRFHPLQIILTIQKNIEQKKSAPFFYTARMEIISIQENKLHPRI